MAGARASVVKVQTRRRLSSWNGRPVDGPLASQLDVRGLRRRSRKVTVRSGWTSGDTSVSGAGCADSKTTATEEK